MDFPKNSVANYVIPSSLLLGMLLFTIWYSSVSIPFALLSDGPQCSRYKHSSDFFSASPRDELESALAGASMANKTLIIAVVNKAYADQETGGTTMLDVFLHSFWLGEGTRPLVKHLLIVAVDQTAYDRCRFLRLNCFRLTTDGVDFGGEKPYMSDDFIKMMWRRTEFLLEVLKRGYNFIFTDTDVMWLRNPFLKLSPNRTEDLQISTDGFSGNPWGEENLINTGFYFVRSNNKTVALFQSWYDLKENSTGKKEQDVLLELIHGGIIGKLGLRVRFLDTLYFSGFCEDSQDLRQVVTVHANCCRSIVAKVADLRTVLVEWKKFIKLSEYKGLENATTTFQWSPHWSCINSWKQ
ncbi:uncharacterized protein At1g28695-like [Momordica charantia]|uniref:Uncharacterized protein At1g28695-like n=1 Tax=Momordica charantia TaxID=3673 RepID=A0A6J1DR72_MOMCH|nr:uncharacterized protein At1g28695-like [Momordica charantia]